MKGERLPGVCKACGNTRAMLTDQPKGVRGVCARCTEEALDEARALLAAERAAHDETRRELELMRATTTGQAIARAQLAEEAADDAQAAQRAAEARAAEAEARAVIIVSALRRLAGRAEQFRAASAPALSHDQSHLDAWWKAKGALIESIQEAQDAPCNTDALTTYIQSLPDDHPAIAGRLAARLSTATAVNEAYGYSNRRMLQTLDTIAASGFFDMTYAARERARMEREEIAIARDRWREIEAARTTQPTTDEGGSDV